VVQNQLIFQVQEFEVDMFLFNYICLITFNSFLMSDTDESSLLDLFDSVAGGPDKTINIDQFVTLHRKVEGDKSLTKEDASLMFRGLDINGDNLILRNEYNVLVFIKHYSELLMQIEVVPLIIKNLLISLSKPRNKLLKLKNLFLHKELTFRLILSCIRY
jgi:hypothetical protein